MNWRTARPGMPAGLRRRFALWRAGMGERRAFRKAYRAYRDRVIPMAEIGNRLVDSWWVLTPLGLMCLWALLDAAGVFK